MKLYQSKEYEIYKLDCIRCGCFLISHQSKNILVDTSMKFERATLLKSLKENGIHRIDGIIITHNHTDHAANAAYLQKLFQCAVYISALGMKGLAHGRCRMPRGSNVMGHVIYWIVKHTPLQQFVKYEACSNVKDVNDPSLQNLLGEHVTIIRTLGHTKDSISLNIENKVCLSGDAFVRYFWMRKISLPWADDECRSEIRPTWKKLLDTGCNVFYPAHGSKTHRTIIENSLKVKPKAKRITIDKVKPKAKRITIDKVKPKAKRIPSIKTKQKVKKITIIKDISQSKEKHHSNKEGEPMKSIYKSEKGKREIISLYNSQLARLKVPYQDRTVTTSFGNTHLIETGNLEGIPLLVFHGGNATTAYNLLACDFLLKEFHIYAVDTIGHPGKSDEVSLSPYNYDYGKWASDVITALGYPKITCFGGSFGAGVIAKTMCVAPDKIKRAVLYVPSGIKNAPAIHSASMLFPMIMYWITHKQKWLKTCIMPMAVTEENIDDDIFETAKCSIDYAKIKKGMPSNVKASDMQMCLAKTLVMAGEKDCLFPAKHVIPRAKKIIPNCTTYLLKDRGHMSKLTDGEKNMIVSFLSGKAY